jgi:hypothetical protein
MRLKRLLVFVVAVFVFFTLTIGASGAIHDIAASECAAQDSQSGAGDQQDPPGQTPGGKENPTANFAGQDHANDKATGGQGAANCENPET